MSYANDFVIENGKLTAYRGPRGNVTIPSGVTAIGDGAFFSCYHLLSVTIPEGVTTIEDTAFLLCEDLQSVVIPGSVTSIGNAAFSRCRSLQSVVIPEGVTSIGASAFSRCENLHSVVIPESVTSIGEEAFSRCGKLQSVVLPKGITDIGTETFALCEDLQSVVIPETVTFIGKAAFFGCNSLQSVNIPEGITFIDTEAFARCPALADPEGFVIVRNVLYNYYGSSDEVSIPECVTGIESYPFPGFRHLRQVTVPERARFSEQLFDSSITVDLLITPGYTPRKQKHRQHQIAAALGYLFCSARYKKTTIVKAYQKYIIRNKYALLPQLFAHDLVQGLVILDQAGEISPQNFDPFYFQPAIDAHATNCVAFLLDWKNRHPSADSPLKLDLC